MHLPISTKSNKYSLISAGGKWPLSADDRERKARGQSATALASEARRLSDIAVADADTLTTGKKQR